MNDNSILNSIKKILGIDESCTDFDVDITMHINTVLSNLVQMGVGPKDGLVISDETTEWSEFIDEPKVQQVKTYVGLKVRLIFDPPASNVVESYNNILKELEWRMYVEKGGY